MQRQTRACLSIILTGAVLATGCQPTQPFYFHEDGDLSHYMDVATQIEYPDVEEPSLEEVTGALPPLTLKNAENYEMWDLSLEEATRITLCNSQVMRQLGGAVANNTPETISRTLINGASVTTTYDPALVESATGSAFGTQFGGTGVEAALSEFDAQLDSSVSFQKNDRPVNTGFTQVFDPTFKQDTMNMQTGVSKFAADGSQFAFRNNTAYDTNTNLVRQGAPAFSQWSTNFEAFFNRPLLQGAGVQYNRIAGTQSFDQYSSNTTNPFDGVVLARIRTDQSLADFEGGVRNLMRDVEQAYWELYFQYRNLEAQKFGRDSALSSWQVVSAKYREGVTGGGAADEARARQQYFQFKADVERALTDLYRAENRLRYIMGLSMSDGRLVRPSDEPTTAMVAFDWAAVHSEALTRRVEVRKQKWEIKKRELEVIAARNGLLPRLDAFGTYRWVGAGDELFGQPNGAVQNFGPGTSAFNTLLDGNFQEWELGVRGSIPIGFRRQLSTVRHHQLSLARDRAILQDLELEISHQLGNAIRDIDLNYGLTQTNFNRRAAAEREVESFEEIYKNGRVTIDIVLQAQNRRAQAETAYFRSLVDYNLAVLDVHFRKGSLLDYNGVYLAEGPWPGKAYFDAMRRARSRDAALYMDYGYTRPNVMSRGPVAQRATTETGALQVMQSTPTELPTPAEQNGTSGMPTPAETSSVPPSPITGFGAASQPRSLGAVATASYPAVEPARVLPRSEEGVQRQASPVSYERQSRRTAAKAPAGALLQ